MRGNDVLASLEVAESGADRRRGLLGRDGIDGALLLQPARSVHTLGMRFAIDVAHLGPDGTVLRVATMKPWRIGAAGARRPLGGRGRGRLVRALGRDPRRRARGQGRRGMTVPCR